MSDENAAVLQAIQELRSDVIHELQAQRQLWGEAESTLLAQGRLHREQIQEHRDRLDNIEKRLTELERITSIPPPSGGHLDG